MSVRPSLGEQLEELQGRLEALERGISHGRARQDTVAATSTRIALQVSECADRHARWDERLVSMLEHDTRRSAEVARKQEDLAAAIGLRPKGGKSRVWITVSYIVLILSLVVSFLVVTPFSALRKWFDRGIAGNNPRFPSAMPQQRKNQNARLRSQSRQGAEADNDDTTVVHDGVGQLGIANLNRSKGDSTVHEQYVRTEEHEIKPNLARDSGAKSNPLASGTNVPMESPRNAASPFHPTEICDTLSDREQIPRMVTRSEEQRILSRNRNDVTDSVSSKEPRSSKVSHVDDITRARGFSTSYLDARDETKKECVALKDGRRMTREEMCFHDARDKGYYLPRQDRQPSWAQDLTQSSGEIEVDESSRDFWDHFEDATDDVEKLRTQ